MAIDLRGADGIGVWFGCLCKPLGVGWCIAIGNVCSVGSEAPVYTVDTHMLQQNNTRVDAGMCASSSLTKLYVYML